MFLVANSSVSNFRQRLFWDIWWQWQRHYFECWEDPNKLRKQVFLLVNVPRKIRLKGQLILVFCHLIVSLVLWTRLICEAQFFWTKLLIFAASIVVRFCQKLLFSSVHNSVLNFEPSEPELFLRSHGIRAGHWEKEAKILEKKYIIKGKK